MPALNIMSVNKLLIPQACLKVMPHSFWPCSGQRCCFGPDDVLDDSYYDLEETPKDEFQLMLTKSQKKKPKEGSKTGC
jgi:hypothetical protein